MSGPLSREARAAEAILDHAIAQLRWLREHLPPVLSRLGDARGTGDGYPSSSSSTSSSTTGGAVTLTPVEAAASRRIADHRPDQAALDVRRLTRRLDRLSTTADMLRVDVAAYTRAPAPPPTVRCKRCAAPTTRPRHGWCERCYVAWQRAGKPTVFPPNVS